jgi:hypothetical protein
MACAAGAYISVGGSSTRCRVLNISTDGAAIVVPNASFIPDRFQLMTKKDRVVRDCRTIWVSGNRIGVTFVDPSEPPAVAD